MMFTNNKQQGPTRLEILTPTVMHVILEFVAYNKSPLPLGSAFEVGWLLTINPGLSCIIHCINYMS